MPLASLAPDPAHVIGLISGTSADGVDAALCKLAGAPAAAAGETHAGHRAPGPGIRMELLAARTTAYPPELRERVLHAADLRTPELAVLNTELGESFAAAALELCRVAGFSVDEVDLIGSHGQTVWHDPRGTRASGPATLQLGEPAVIAARTGRNVVADFRPADVALGGEGAPLVPYVDFLLLARPDRTRAVLNLGGIANVTWLPAGTGVEHVVAFDTGPGNMLLDALVRRYGLAADGFDAGGRLALQGQVHEPLLKELMDHEFFALPPPRSTGRELFGDAFLEGMVQRGERLRLSPLDLLATATALTARSTARALERFCGAPAELLLCGGGRRNLAVRRALAAALPGSVLLDTDDEGLDGDAKEAIAFAVLAWLAARGYPNHLPRTTGASRRTVLGKFIWGEAQ